LTSGLVPACRLIVVGVDARDAEVARLPLGHGDDPTTLLALHGWDVRRVRDVVRHPITRHLLTMTFVVDPSFAPTQTATTLTSGVQPRREPVNQSNPVSAVMAESDVPGGEIVLRHQRVAAYAVVTSSRGFLMTEFSDRTGAPGQWGLPGGGLDAGEAPDGAVVREVWEESGQRIELGELALIRTSRWVGRAPSGRLEDYHAVRVVYRALCPEPTEPVVHDVGGTTASAAWLLPADLVLLALTPGWRSILRDVAWPVGSGAEASDVVMAPDETDGPDRHHHDTHADDRGRPQL
jgi:8-oxo-dGTP pyrophosphatase MutT (NUDIX family)